MQDTNTTNTITATPSSLKKEKAAPVSPPVIEVKSIVTRTADIKPAAHTLIQKLVMFLTGVFLRKKTRNRTSAKKIELVIIPEKKNEAAAMEEQVQKLVSAVANAPVTKIQNVQTPENTLRKIAERQFLTMDVTQATRN